VRAFRADEMLTVAAPMPGLTPEDIRVEVTAQGHLILEGRSTPDSDQAFGAIKSGSKEILVDEWAAGPYYREVSLETAVNGEAATVTYGNGVLVVAMPIAESTRPAEIRLDSIGAGRGERTPGHT
jgi:HSP20 family molecular chaperone IbpA